MTDRPGWLAGVLRRVPRAAAGFAVVVGVLVLASWLFEIRLHAVLGFSLMVPNTSVMTLLSGVALWVAASESFARARGPVVFCCAAVVIAIAGITLVEYLAHVDLGIDRLLHGAQGATMRPSPQTSVAFLLIGAALVAHTTGRRRRWADLPAIAATLIALGALLGYLFDVPVMYGFPTRLFHTVMSAWTAGVVVALGLGLLALQIERGPLAVLLASDQGGIAARQLLVGLVAFPPIAIALIAGARAGWYTLPVATAFVLLFAFAEATAFILWTATRLSAIDSAGRRISVALRDSEERVRTLLEQASDAIFVADLDGRYVDVNEAGCRMLGYSRTQLVGKTIIDLLPHEDVPRLSASKARLLAGAVDIGEWTLRKSDGSYLPVEVSAKILPDGRWQGIVRDITERRRAVAALARAAALERALVGDLEALASASSAVSETLAELPDLDAVLRTIAEQARLLTGAEFAAAAVGTDPERPFDRWAVAGMPADAVERIGRLPHAVGVLGAVTRGETIRVADVTRHPAFTGLPANHPPMSSFLAAPIRHRRRAVGSLYLANKQGGPEFSEHDARIVAALCDRVAAAIETATLYAAETRMRVWMQSVVDQLPEGVIVVDEHGKVTAINRTMLAFGAETDAFDASGNPVRFDVRDRAGQPVPVANLPLARALDGEQVRDEELQLARPDGTLVPIAASATPIQDGARLAGAVLAVRDISERKEMERLREEWVAVVAHDLRQPLNTIVLTADRLAALADDERARGAVERIRNAAWRLNRLVEDLLDAARIAAHRVAIDPRAVDLVGLARGAIENAHLASPTATLQLVSADRELAWVDPDRVLQVLDNLISNAIKYGRQGAEIRIEIASRDPWIEVTVTSQGETIPPSELRQLFGRFSRTRQARTARLPGIGLGLYICKGLVEAHGGQIWADSEQGTTTFHFTIPRPVEG